MKIQNLIFSIFFLALGSCAQAHRNSFVSDMDWRIGTSVDGDLSEVYSDSEAFRNKLIYVNGNNVHVEYDYFDRDCRIGAVYDQNQIMIEWYFVSEPDGCKIKLDWGRA